MAILDGKLELMDATSITGAAAATVGSDYIDLGTGYDTWDQTQTPNIGEGGELYLNVRVATALSQTGGANVTPLLKLTLFTYSVAGDMEGLGSTLIYREMTLAQTVVGSAIIRAKIPAGECKRYLQLMSQVGKTTVSAGALDAWVSLDSESDYPVT